MKERRKVLMKIRGAVSFTAMQSPLGAMTLAATDAGLCGVWFEHQRYSPDMASWQLDDGNAILLAAQDQIAEYFQGRREVFTVPLDLSHGTQFQQVVWRALLSIPCGATSTYSVISQRCGRPAAVRAVGGAIGRNPLSIIVPCHRVVGGDGSLTGYAGGLERKTALLKLEGAL